MLSSFETYVIKVKSKDELLENNIITNDSMNQLFDPFTCAYVTQVEEYFGKTIHTKAISFSNNWRAYFIPMGLGDGYTKKIYFNWCDVDDFIKRYPHQSQLGKNVNDIKEDINNVIKCIKHFELPVPTYDLVLFNIIADDNCILSFDYTVDDKLTSNKYHYKFIFKFNKYGFVNYDIKTLVHDFVGIRDINRIQNYFIEFAEIFNRYLNKVNVNNELNITL